MSAKKVQAWIIWLLVVTFTIWLQVIQTGYAVFNIPLQKSLNLTIEQIGLVAAVYPCTAAIIQLFSGTLLDELGPTKTIIPAVLVGILGVIIFARATTFYHILIAQFIFACSTCFAFVGCGYMIGKWFPKHQFGQVFGFAQVLISMSAAFGQIGFGYMLKIMTWRQILNIFTMVGFLLFILMYRFIKLPNSRVKKSKFDYRILAKVVNSSIYVVRKKNVMLSSIYGGIVFGYIWAFGTLWLPKILIKKGLMIQVANKSVSCLWLGVAIGSLFVDKLWRKIGSTKVTLRVMIMIQTLLLYIIAFSELKPMASMGLSFLFGVATSSHMLTYTIAKQAVEENYYGSAISIVNASMFMIGGLFVSAIGFIIGRTQETLIDYQHVIVWFSLIIIVAFFATNYMEDGISSREPAIKKSRLF
jgi:MFS family permease